MSIGSVRRCRACLCADEAMLSLGLPNLRELLYEATNISLGSNLENWECLCWQCETLLKKYVKFRRKVICNHNLLLQVLQHDQVPPVDFDKITTKPLVMVQCTRSNVFPWDPCAEENEIFGDVKIEHEEKLEVKDEMEFMLVENHQASDYEDTQNSNVLEYMSTEEQYQNTDGTKFRNEISSLENYSYKQSIKNKLEKRSKLKRKVKNKTCSKSIISDSVQIDLKPRKILQVDPRRIQKIVLTKEEQIKVMEERAKSKTYLQFPFKCDICVKGFNYQQKLASHMMEHDKNRADFECDICHVYIDCPEMHALLHSVEYRCCDCEYRSAYKRRALQHYATAHEGVSAPQYQCQYCEKNFKSKVSHINHEQNHKTGDRYQCDYCNKTYKTKGTMINHLLLHTAPKEFQCEICQKWFHSKTNLGLHQRSHQPGSTDYPCLDCNTYYKSRSILEYHLKTSAQHIDDKMLKFKCGQCGKRYWSECFLKTHMAAKHDGEKRFFCPICGLKFSTNGGLKKHNLRTHQGILPERKYICETCGRAFTSQNGLQNHIRTHTGERPFSCERCGNTFTQKAALGTHVRLVHLKLKRNVGKKKKYAEIPEQAIT